MISPWIILPGLLLLQALVLLPAIACFVRERRLAYYAALYWTPITLALLARLMGSEDWLVAAIVQSLLSVAYNLQISFAGSGKWWLGG